MSDEAYIWIVLRRLDGSASVLSVPAPPPSRLTVGGVTYRRQSHHDPAGRSRRGLRAAEFLECLQRVW